eukprot:100625_1
MQAITHLLFCGFAILILLCLVYGDPIPTVPLYNAAEPNTFMPLVGLGTGGYKASAARSPQATPEHWNATEGFINTLKWFSLNGTSWDTALNYQSLPGVAQGLLNATNHWTTTDRKDVWITSKIGLGGPMGYKDTLKEFEQLITLFNTSYIDLILIHWPSDNRSTSWKSTDVYCNATNDLYDPTTCRQHTWKAMEWIFNHSGARAIGVSNFEVRHLEDIFNLNSLIPAVNQFEFHGYWHEHDLVEYCQSYKIQVNSYAPLGTPDVMEGYWKPVLTQHPVATAIGNKYHKSAAQVWLRWAVQQGIVVNPRSWNIAHQHQNMQIFDFELDQNEMLSLASIRAPSDNKICPDPHYWQ